VVHLPWQTETITGDSGSAANTRNRLPVIAEVMRTAHGPVVVYRSHKGVTVGPAPITGEPYEYQSMSKPGLRMITDGPFICFCKCSRTILEEADFTAPIEKGRRRVVWRHTATGLDK
jgi:hypothetical protein